MDSAPGNPPPCSPEVVWRHRKLDDDGRRACADSGQLRRHRWVWEPARYRKHKKRRRWRSTLELNGRRAVPNVRTTNTTHTFNSVAPQRSYHHRATGRHLSQRITPATRRKWTRPAVSWYSIYLSRRDERLSWPRLPGNVPAGNRTRDMSDAITINHYTTEPPRDLLSNGWNTDTHLLHVFRKKTTIHVFFCISVENV